MKRTYWVVGLLLISLSSISLTYAEDYIDDVYYWPDTENQSTINYYPIQSTDDTAEDSDTSPKISVEFIEDSITRQNPDTVVKVIIRRQ